MRGSREFRGPTDQVPDLQDVGQRHLHYTHNFKGDAPPRTEKKKKTAAALVLSSSNSDVEKYKARICVKGNDQEPATPWGETLD